MLFLRYDVHVSNHKTAAGITQKGDIYYALNGVCSHFIWIQTTSRSHIVQKGSHIVHFQNHVFTLCLLCSYKVFTVWRVIHHRWPLNNPSWLLT